MIQNVNIQLETSSKLGLLYTTNLKLANLTKGSTFLQPRVNINHNAWENTQHIY